MTLRGTAALVAGVALVAAAPGWAQSSARDFDRAAEAIKTATMVDPSLALHRADEAGRIAATLSTQHDRDIAIATVDRLRGEALMQMDRADRAAPLIASALARVRHAAPGTKLEGETLLSSGGVHAGLTQLAAAFADYEAAHRIFLTIGDTRDESLALLSIGNLYGDATDFPKSLKYLDEAIAVDSSDSHLMLAIQNNRGSVLQELGRYRDAEAGYRRALALAQGSHSLLLEARILGNIARVRLKVGDVVGAEHVLAAALPLARADPTGAARLSLIAIAAQAALQTKDYRRAETLIAERFAGVNLDTTTIPAREAHRTAYETYRALGDERLAIAHLAALKRLDDQATRLATSANSALAAAAFDFANQELTYERARARTQRLIFAGAAVATLLLIALLGIWLETLRRSRNRVRAVADDLAVTNAALGKALAAKTEFLATTSHEIRTPLNGILGMTQVMLADAKLAGETRDRIELVHGAGVTMRALVDDILDVAKMETGNLTIDRAPFDLAATLGEAARIWIDQARDKGLAFELDLDDAPTMIEGDAARVRQIVFNLLANALKFTREGTIRLSVTSEADRYRLVVADTGIGIPHQKHEAIFESFRQADAGTTRQFGGTGLGLTICRNLARAMEGEVEVASVPGEGSTFTVTLPLVRVAAAAGPTAVSVDLAETVVIIDANPITRAMLKALVLARRPDTVAVASIAEAAAHRAGLFLVDQNAGDPAAIAQLASEAPVTVLWRGDPPDTLATIARVLAKPIAGPALVAALFDPSLSVPLVRRAA